LRKAEKGPSRRRPNPSAEVHVGQVRGLGAKHRLSIPCARQDESDRRTLPIENPKGLHYRIELDRRRELSQIAHRERIWVGNHSLFRPEAKPLLDDRLARDIARIRVGELSIQMRARATALSHRPIHDLRRDARDARRAREHLVGLAKEHVEVGLSDLDQSLGQSVKKDVGPEIEHVYRHRNAVPAPMAYAGEREVNGGVGTVNDVGLLRAAGMPGELARQHRVVHEAPQGQVFAKRRRAEQSNLDVWVRAEFGVGRETVFLGPEVEGGSPERDLVAALREHLGQDAGAQQSRLSLVGGQRLTLLDQPNTHAAA